MKRFMAAWCIVLASAFGQPLIAQNEERGVPIENAPYHLPVFKNEYVTLLRIYVPPQRNTGYHTHSGDSVSVNIQDADMTNQDLGAPQPGPAQRGQRGRATFTAYSKQEPRTHKASNVGPTPFHNVSFIFKTNPGRFTPSSRGDVRGYEQVMDNERIRGWRLVLEPGQSVAAITQQAPGVRIVVAEGELVESVPGQPDRAMALKLGEFFWQDPGVTRAIRNNGTTRLEIVEFELK
jgi:quercetin dioxygenase-like cupin family protein